MCKNSHKLVYFYLCGVPIAAVPAVLLAKAEYPERRLLFHFWEKKPRAKSEIVKKLLSGYSDPPVGGAQRRDGFLIWCFARKKFAQSAASLRTERNMGPLNGVPYFFGMMGEGDSKAGPQRQGLVPPYGTKRVATPNGVFRGLSFGSCDRIPLSRVSVFFKRYEVLTSI